eukprot:gene25571-11222_t
MEPLPLSDVQQGIAELEARAEERASKIKEPVSSSRRVLVLGWSPEATGELVAGFSEFSPPGTTGAIGWISESSPLEPTVGIDQGRPNRARPDFPLLFVIGVDDEKEEHSEEGRHDFPLLIVTAVGDELDEEHSEEYSSLAGCAW